MKKETDQFPIADVLASCDRLDNRLANKVVSILLGKNSNQDQEDLTQSEALILWTANVLQCAPLGKSERWMILQKFGDEIKKFGDFINQAMEGRKPESVAVGALPVAKIGIGDRLFASITGHSKLLDLESGEFLDGVKNEFAETIQYNLAAAFAIGYAKCKAVKAPSE